MAGKVLNIKVCSPLKLRSGLTGNYHAICHYSYNLPLPTRRRKNSDTENDRENGLRMNNKMIMKEKRFSFFADPQERKAESRSTFGTLPFARHTSQHFAKFKEPNHSNSLKIITFALV